eukprot:4524961-Pyramimonas_sp.AAC.1
MVHCASARESHIGIPAVHGAFVRPMQKNDGHWDNPPDNRRGNDRDGTVIGTTIGTTIARGCKHLQRAV